MSPMAACVISPRQYSNPFDISSQQPSCRLLSPARTNEIRRDPVSTVVLVNRLLTSSTITSARPMKSEDHNPTYRLSFQTFNRSPGLLSSLWSRETHVALTTAVWRLDYILCNESEWCDTKLPDHKSLGRGGTPADTNMSNKTKTHERGALRKRLTACFGGGCQKISKLSAEASMAAELSNTTIGISSSIFEGPTRALSCHSGRSEPPPRRCDSLLQPTAVVPTYEQDPRTFCEVSLQQIRHCLRHDQVGPPASPPADKAPVLGIDFSFSKTSNLDAMRSRLSSMSPLEQASRTPLVHPTGKPQCHPEDCSPLRMSFATGKNLVTMFEYPSYHSAFQGEKENELCEAAEIIVD